MSALVSYESSDEAEEVDNNATATLKIPAQISAANARIEGNKIEIRRDEISARDGYLIGPSGPPASILMDREDKDINSASQSPYSANRALAHDLTFPPVPNFDIPPSPPGSPLPGMDHRFGHFLELKKNGVHFNEKLARSSALKNPSLLQKLMSFAGVDDLEQYVTTLSADLWDPARVPVWAYKEELAKSHSEVSKKREDDKVRLGRESIDFIKAPISGQSSTGGTPAPNAGVKGLRTSAVERVLAGLDRERV